MSRFWTQIGRAIADRWQDALPIVFMVAATVILSPWILDWLGGASSPGSTPVDKAFSFSIRSHDLTLPVIGVVGIALLATQLLKYLRAGDGTANAFVMRQLSSLERKVASIAHVRSSENGSDIDVDIGRMAEFIQPKIEEAVIAKLSDKYLETYRDAKAAEAIASQFDAVIMRLSYETRALTRRGNVNLVIGVVTSMIAVGLLVSLTYGIGPAISAKEMPDITVWQKIALNLIPKATIAIFVEVLAYFFLGLYRRTLTELYTYHSDMTRVTLQRVAVQAAWVEAKSGAKATLSKDLLSANPLAKLTPPDEKPAEGDIKFDKVMETVLTALAKGVAEKIKLDDKKDAKKE